MATVSRGTTQERYRFIKQHHQQLGIRFLCRWLKVSHSGYYAWLKRPESMHKQQDRMLRHQVLQTFSASKGRYGAPRIHQQLRQDGTCIARKRVARLMREMGLKARVARIYRRTPGITRFYAKHQNLLLEQGAPQQMDQQWVGDLTYIRVGRQWRYLSVVMDKHSRRILGWKLGTQKTAALTCKVLRQALNARKPKAGLIFHTDRGVEYGAHEVQDLLKKQGILSSMNRPGCCTDNGYMESFFHSLKAELIHGRHFNTDEQLKRAVNEYIIGFYNPKRLHSGLGYQSPVEYEKNAA
ncbi:IS3 family transposase [Marinospirillum sp.]|uniref:IS3 family transposase n=1 Tax=Marinospirillum sp. TaxID=2183934 RepID=UPI00384B5E04